MVFTNGSSTMLFLNRLPVIFCCHRDLDDRVLHSDCSSAHEQLVEVSELLDGVLEALTSVFHTKLSTELTNK